MRKSFYISLLFLFIGSAVKAQNTFPMQNGTTSDCNGIFKDSEAGATAGNYEHDESYVFTICVPGAQNITMVFSSFCTELYNDSLEAFDGNSVNAKKLGAWSGTKGPSTVASTGTCLTFRFSSDKSVACSGWEAEWTTSIKQIIPPKIVLNPSASCDDNSIVIKMDSKVSCDSLRKYAGYNLFGPNSPTVTNFTPINCDGNNKTDEVRINLSKGIDRSGNYKLRYTTVVPDPCDSLRVFYDSLYFKVTDCPIAVDLTAKSDTICKGSCTDITAMVTGGDPSKYSYSWTNGPTGKGPVTVCPTVTTTYILTVSDGNSVPGKDTITITVLDPPSLRSDTILCFYNPILPLTATPSTGYWFGPGVTDAKKGEFTPSVADEGIHQVYYSLGGDCLDSIKVEVRKVRGATANAACPGSAPFYVWSYSPRGNGGKWTGKYIDSAGRVTPPNKDTTFTVTYTWKGCSVNKKINIVGPKVENRYDTVCLSDPIKRMRATPAGAIWRGAGVTNWYWCDFDPVKAGPGNHILTLESKGCFDTTFMYVVDIDAKYNEVTCPYETEFELVKASPFGGIWQGKGIVDSIQGTYDPSFTTSNYNDTLTYVIGKCTDKKIVYVRNTKVFVDTLKFCIEDSNTLLQWKSVQNTPGGGIWSGNGVTGNYFKPIDASYGVHTLRYTANTCTDSVIMVIHPQADIQVDTTFCIGNAPFQLRNASNKGVFSGKGITNGAQGIFDPKKAGVGVHKIRYSSEFGCGDSVMITVDPLPVVSFIGLANFYCLKDQNYLLEGTPAGGVFSGNGVTGDYFNPRDAGTGKHSITYTFGKASCNASQTKTVDVGDTLVLTAYADDDSICPGENAQIYTTAKGGDPSNYIYSWSSGQGDVTSILVNPNAYTVYSVSLDDGCSDIPTQNVPIFVHPKPQGIIQTSPIQCYGEDGWAKVIMQDAGNYSYEWNTNPINYTDSIYRPVTSWNRVIATNLETGCVYDTTATIPGYERINAAFSTVPRNTCLNNLRPDLLVIDQSVGGVTGTWDFGDGTVSTYNQDNPEHTYAADTSQYTITLIIENDGGCKDTAYLDICMDDSIVIFVPDAFTPTARDNINPTLAIRGGGLVHYELVVFNRWGEIVFKSEDITEEWDGTLAGKECPQGLYGYKIIYKGKSTSYKEKVGAVYLLR